MRYHVTYVFNGYLRGAYAEPVRLITETVAAMRREGVDIEFLGATQEINPSGQLIEATARYSAPSKGTVGRLNCRACLPASGPPQYEDVSRTGPDDREPTGAPRRRLHDRPLIR